MRNRIKIYFSLIVGIIFLFFLNLKGVGGQVKIDHSGQSKIDVYEWSNIIADEANKKGVTLVVDGNVIPKTECDTYINENRELMLAADSLTDIFQCSYRLYNQKKLVIEKGETRLIANVNSATVEINDVVTNLSSKIEIKEGTIYVPADILATGFSYAYVFNVVNNEASLINTKNAEKIIPTKYDYRTDGRMGMVKDQESHSTCWAFAALTALESTILPDRVRDYSEKNMTLNNGYLVSLMSGGDYSMAMSYLAAWRGPILEDSEVGYGAYDTPTDVMPDVHVQEIQLIKGKDLDAIKKAAFLYGGVETSIYMAIDANNLDSYYFNKENNAYCYMGIDRPNHEVVIIGWDDNYSKNNFNFTPEGDGAFICQNSWGENFGEKGVFYVSYYDSNIGMNNVIYTGVESNDNYDNIYQTDICGLVGHMGYESEEAYFANAYTAISDEILEAVSFYATEKNTEYEIFFVDNFENTEDFSKKYFVKRGTFTNAGYYTVKLDREIKLDAGKKYAVVVRIKSPNAVRPVAIEYVASYETSNVDISDGEGYISYKGKIWERVEETKQCNICLKMFTNNR